jgi:hypothetical protein
MERGAADDEDDALDRPRRLRGVDVPTRAREPDALRADTP